MRRPILHRSGATRGPRPFPTQRRAQFRLGLIALVLAGCRAEVDDPYGPIGITGSVTYQGKPVKKGAMSFLPYVPGKPSVSAKILDGQIRDVSTASIGDGIRPGKYKVTITAFDDAYEASTANRKYYGAEMDEVAKAMKNPQKFIPARYSDIRESKLVAEVSPNRRVLRFDLVD